MIRDIEIKECLPGTEEFDFFLAVTDRVYQSATPPSIKKELETEGLLTCLVAMEDEIPKARVALYHNPSITRNAKNTLLLGYFESVEEPVIVRQLFERIVAFANENDFKVLIGPINGSTWNDYRFNLSPFAPPFFSQMFHPPYYASLFEENGFSIAEHYQTSMANISISGSLEEEEDYLRKHNLTIRQIDLEYFEKELIGIFSVCNTAFATNPFFSATTQSAFVEKYLPLKKFLDPKFILLAENDMKQAVGIFFSFPDLYQPERLVVKTVVKTSTAPKGLMTIMSQRIYRTASEQNFKKALHAYIHQQNKSLRLSTNFGGHIYQQHAVFVRELL